MRFALTVAMVTAYATLTFAATAPFDPQHPLVEYVDLHGAHHWGTIFIFKLRPSGGTEVSRDEAQSAARAMVRDHHGLCELQAAVEDEHSNRWRIAFSCRQ